MILGAIIDAGGFALLLLLGTDSPYWLMIPAFMLMPGGMGLGVPAMTTAILASVDKRLSGVASAVLNAARQAAGAIGVALFGALVGDGRESGGGRLLPDQVVGGIHHAAMGAAILLLGTALMAGLLVGRRRA
jgi:DHA2 family methylenomycin A resistance protein-like MFS transporter